MITLSGNPFQKSKRDETTIEYQFALFEHRNHSEFSLLFKYAYVIIFKNLVGSSPHQNFAVASFLLPLYIDKDPH